MKKYRMARRYVCFLSLKKGERAEMEASQEDVVRFKRLKTLTGIFIEIGLMFSMIVTTLILILFEEEELSVFFIIAVIGIGIFISESWRPLYVFNFIDLWFYWLVISFAYFLLKYEIELHVVLDVLLDLAIFSFLFYKMFYTRCEYPLFYCAVVLLMNLLPFDSHSSFHSMIESSVRCVLFFVAFVVQNFYKRVCVPAEKEHLQGVLIILRNNYIFFTNAWTLLFFFPVHMTFMAVKMYQRWPSSSIMERLVEEDVHSIRMVDRNRGEDVEMKSEDEGEFENNRTR
jgi:hypothetical protein